MKSIYTWVSNLCIFIAPAMLNSLEYNPFHPDNLPNDTEILMHTTAVFCISCGNDLIHLWEAQCCKSCLKIKIREEDSSGWLSKKKFHPQDFKPGTLFRAWWRGNKKSAFIRMVIAAGTEDGNPWLSLMDPVTKSLMCWGSHSIQLSVVPLLRGGHLGIQKIC